MNEFEEFLMFAARFIFILSQKIYNTTLDIVWDPSDFMVYPAHLSPYLCLFICKNN